MSKKVIVLGAGVIGLSSAVTILQTHSDVTVEIVADKFSPETTGDGSAGYWEPYKTGDTDIAWIRKVSSQTYRYLKDLAQSKDAAKTGTSVLSGYSLDRDAKSPRHVFHDFVDGYRMLTPAEVASYPGAKSGFFWTSTQVDVSTYLPWLMNKFKALGGTTRRASVASLAELAGQCDIVVNCCGIGAHALLGDKDVYPIRGQVIRIKAPWLKHFYILDGGKTAVYVLPGTSSVVVGGTADVGDWGIDVRPDVNMNIWEGAKQLLPQLEDAEILHSWVGLRPARTRVRLEVETLATPTGPLKVVHNYGHGGAGVTLHWGCALEATGHVGDMLGRSPGVKARL